MPIQTGLPKAYCPIPERLKIRLAKYIRRRLLWIVPLRPWEPDGFPVPLPPWVRPLFACDPDIAEMVLVDTELAAGAALSFPEGEAQRWQWLKKVAYRIARAYGFRESGHLAALQPPTEEGAEMAWDLAIPCVDPSPEAVAEARELLLLGVHAWGDSTRAKCLLEAILTGIEANTQETPLEAGQRRRNIAYRRQRVREALESLDGAHSNKAA